MPRAAAWLPALTYGNAFVAGSAYCHGVAEYRLYCLDFDGTSVAAEWIEAANDSEALQRARAMQGLRRCEVWQGHRLIATLTEFELLNYAGSQPASSAPLEY